MKYTDILILVIGLTVTGCGNSSQQTSSIKPLYGSQVVERMEQPIQKTMKIGFFAPSDSIKRYGAQNILLLLAAQECKTPCFVDLWDDRDAFRLNQEHPYGKRTEKWQKKNFVFIADHLVATKAASDDDIVNYPLTYDSNYKRWGGKLKH